MNLASGINTGVTGAQLGGQLGGGMGAAIGGTIGLVAGLFSNTEKQALKQNEAWNKQVTNNVARSLFDLERQRVSERMRTTSAMLDYNANRSTTLSTLRSQYAAADVIGSSSNALKQAYAFQLDQAMAQEMFNFEVGIDNYNTNVMQVVNQGLGQLRGSIQGSGGLDLKNLVAGIGAVKSGVGAMKGAFGGNSGASGITGIIGGNGQVSYSYGGGSSLGIS